MRTILKAILKGVGIHEPREARDGAEGLEILRHYPADIALVDFSMTPIDGVEFTRTVRLSSDASNPHLQIVMITGHSEQSRVDKGGKEVFIQASYNPIFDDTGTVVKVVKFATDVTETVTKRMRNDSLGHDINLELGDVINQMVTATQRTASASNASTETGSIINSVAAASEKLSHSVQDIAQSMSYARKGVQGVFKHAEKANVSASSLNASATSMNAVVTMIQDIASQINLLALNATIESARAGDAGKGFAVVALEVKSLANQAAHSTQRIASEIASMQTVTTEVVAALNLISNDMNTVLENVANVAGAIVQQNAVTMEISNNMQPAVSAVHEIEESLGNISGTFANVATASEQVMQNVETLVA